MEFKFVKAQKLKEKPNSEQLGFGVYYTDYMFEMDYTEGIGWHDGRIVPYGPLTLDPAVMVLHYGQEVFEGLKAYRAKDGRILLFRPWKNVQRMNRSNDRICIPQIDEKVVLCAINDLVSVEADWVPSAEGTSLYIRPFIFATEPHVGVHPSKAYKFMIILSPVGAYYAGGINPVKIFVEDEYVRSVKGGVGEAKTGGNYASSLKSQMKANEIGYTQVLWLDGVHRKYVEEVGTMNVFFKIKGEVVTPALDGSILPGVTRDSVIELLKSWDVPVSERKISIDEIMEAGKNGTLEEAFGTGTAAVISPIGELNYKGEKTIINGEKIGPLSQKIYDELTGIQWGRLTDKFGWTAQVK